MRDHGTSGMIAIAGMITIVALVAVLISKSAQTSAVISAIGSGFTGALGAAIAA